MLTKNITAEDRLSTQILLVQLERIVENKESFGKKIYFSFTKNAYDRLLATILLVRDLDRSFGKNYGKKERFGKRCAFV